jgi:hypothetical protein
MIRLTVIVRRVGNGLTVTVEVIKKRKGGIHETLEGWWRDGGGMVEEWLTVLDVG